MVNATVTRAIAMGKALAYETGWSDGLDHGEEPPRAFMVAPSGVLSEGYGHDGLGVCLSDSQTEAEEVPSQGGRGDALLRRMPP